VVVSKILYFYPYFGEMIPFAKHIFQMGWLWRNRMLGFWSDETSGRLLVEPAAASVVKDV